MSYTSLLINTCTVRRNTPGVANAYGYPTPSWADYLTDQACRIQDAKGKEILVGAEVVVADYKLFLQDIDITEQDRVVISAVTYEVLMVTDKQDSATTHHKECYLKTVR